MLIVAAVVMVVKKPTRDRRHRRARRPSVAALLAFVIGAYDGFFGPGTGTFLIVGFVALCGRSLVNASADAKIVNFASNLAAVAIFAWRGTIRGRSRCRWRVGPAARRHRRHAARAQGRRRESSARWCSWSPAR